MQKLEQQITNCYHCGEPCKENDIEFAEKHFCCQGCKNVFSILHQHQLDNYYCLNEKPGTTVQEVNSDKFLFLTDDNIAAQLITFKNNEQTQATFYLPQIHCSSCLWLLENLSSINKHIIFSQVNFATKEISLAFQQQHINLKDVATLLSSIGYEPLISLQENNGNTKTSATYSSQKAAYKLGITGFCFANIMLISFPEYVGMHWQTDQTIATFFRYINVFLALPVVFYGAQEFFKNAWYSVKQRYLNIDAPIALAIAVTFGRSLYEVFSNTGGGYFDSMSGIVFFMLLGRTLQNRAYSTLQFNRDYKSYFPIAVSVIEKEETIIKKIQDIQQDDLLKLHHGEIVPTDCLLAKGNARLDYSFVTGEDAIETARVGEIIYAGARLTGGGIEAIAIKPFSQNSFTRLWDNQAFRKNSSDDKQSSITIISKYFSIIVLLIAGTAFTYWYPQSSANAWNALTAVLIVACPCALLLTATFTNGYLIDHLSKIGFFIRNASVIEELTKTNSIVFDKTGTITQAGNNNISIPLMELNEEELQVVLAGMAQSLHPYSKAIVQYYGISSVIPDLNYKEITGKGIEIWHNDRLFKIGSWLHVNSQQQPPTDKGSAVWISVDGFIKAHFLIRNAVREGLPALFQYLNNDNYQLSLLSGDHSGSVAQMASLIGTNAPLLFEQSPQQKLAYIQKLQKEKKHVMMIGDGLNDAGALKQSNVGVAVVQQSFSFSPASDVIIQGSQLKNLGRFIKVARNAQHIILFAFIYSIIFNIAGIYFAVTAQLSPLIAAILMPSSSLGIMLIAFLGVNRSTREIRRNSA